MIPARKISKCIKNMIFTLESYQVWSYESIWKRISPLTFTGDSITAVSSGTRPTFKSSVFSRLAPHTGKARRGSANATLMSPTAGFWQFHVIHHGVVRLSGCCGLCWEPRLGSRRCWGTGALGSCIKRMEREVCCQRRCSLLLCWEILGWFSLQDCDSTGPFLGRIAVLRTSLLNNMWPCKEWTCVCVAMRGSGLCPAWFVWFKMERGMGCHAYSCGSGVWLLKKKERLCITSFVRKILFLRCCGLPGRLFFWQCLSLRSLPFHCEEQSINDCGVSFQKDLSSNLGLGKKGMCVSWCL